MTHPHITLPPPLTHGARIGILSPSGPVLHTHIDAGIKTLQSWGFEPVVDPQTFARNPSRGYLAGDDATRLHALQAALDSPDLDAIMFSRGGYGAMRLLPHLDATNIKTYPKHIIGFSDITAILMWCYHQANLMSVHGPVVKSLSKEENNETQRTESAHILRKLLTHERIAFTQHDLKISAPHTTPVSGPVIAGNLSLIQALLHTPYLPSLKGCILILEDVTEPDYRLDRLFTSLKLKLQHDLPHAIVLGSFLACDGVYIKPEQLEDYIHALALELGVPVASNYPTSHGPLNHAIPVGLHGTLDPTTHSLHISPL